jgi:hypothetical protein
VSLRFGARWKFFFAVALPALVIAVTILRGLWLVPDWLIGMYGNYDGNWASWNVRGILTWSRSIDFSPFTPLAGTGSLFLPNLPWFNPGALMMALPVPLAYAHLASYIVYAVELVVSLFVLFRVLSLSRYESFLAVLLYFYITFPPFDALIRSLTWYTLAPVNAHLMSMASLALAAWLVLGREPRLAFIYATAFSATILIGFISAPVTFLTYLPIYALVGLVMACTTRPSGREIAWKIAVAGATILLLWAVGLFDYLSATAQVSARGVQNYPAILHPGSALLTFGYWVQLCKSYMVSYGHVPNSFMDWFQIAGVAGAAILAGFGRGERRAYGAVVLISFAGLQFYELLSHDVVLGHLHVLSPPYFEWCSWPFLAGALVSGGAMFWRVLMPKYKIDLRPAVGVAAAFIVWLTSEQWIFPYQPRFAGIEVLGLPAIAHREIEKGAIHNYLESHIALFPGSQFRGYASLWLGAPDGITRRATGLSGDAITAAAHTEMRQVFLREFGHRFQATDLWNSGIPTLEEYGQWLTRQMFSVLRDLFSISSDELDPIGSSTYLFRLNSRLLAAFGVRFVVSDGPLNDGAYTERAVQTGHDGSKLWLYELGSPNLGQYSPTSVALAQDYAEAIELLRRTDLQRSAVALTSAGARFDKLTTAADVVLRAVRDGYHVSARAPGAALLVLPVQYSHCWRLSAALGLQNPRLVRLNLVQTGIYFERDLNATLSFDFQPWRSGCRFEDASEMKSFPTQRTQKHE